MSMTTQIISWDEYAKHTNNLDCWVLVDGYLYDTTSYLAQHPGGDQILLKHSGFDATAKFNSINHSEYAKSIRDARRLGKIEDSPMPEGHTQKVQQIKQQYNQAKRKREQERKIKLKQQMNNQNKDSKTYYSQQQISSHNTPSDCWIIYGNKVYDVSKYHQQHPGGPQYITDLAGKNATTEFDKINHSSAAKDIRQRHFVGYVSGMVEQKKSNVPYLVIVLGILVFGLYFVSSKWF